VSNKSINRRHDTKIKELVEEKEYYKQRYKKIKPMFEDSKQKLKVYYEEYSKLQKSFEERKAISDRKTSTIPSNNRSIKDSFSVEKSKFEQRLYEAEALTNQLREKVK
jgi:hypothetical protein